MSCRKEFLISMSDYYEFLKGLNLYLNNPNLSNSDKLLFIQMATDTYIKQVDKEYKKYRNNQILSGALQIGSAAIPVVGESALAGVASKMVVPRAVSGLVGRRLPQDVIKGAVGGAVSSALLGIGRGISQDENVLKIAIEDSIFGTGAGAVVGGAMGKIEQKLQEMVFDACKTNPKLIKAIGKKNVIKSLKTYYKDYVQTISDKHPKIGKYNYTSNPGLSDTITQKFNEALDVANLRQNVKQAEYLGVEPLKHERNSKNIINQFHRFRLGDKDYIFSEDKFGKINYHITKSNNKTPTKVTAPIAEPQSEMEKIPFAYSITDFMKKNNTPNWLSSELATNMLPILDKKNDSGSGFSNSIEKSQDVLAGRIEQWNLPESSTITDFADNNFSLVNNDNLKVGTKIFTPEEIGKMTPEEFSKNETIIANQLKQGLIKSQENDFSNLLDYKNGVSGENKIYTRETIGNMTLDEYTRLEPEINAQLKSIGIPSNSDLQNINDLIYVAPYVRHDGTKVSGYFRKR